MRDFRTLRVWRCGHRFVLDVYSITRRFPADERLGLTSQLRRAATAITAAIAEGCGACSDAEQRRIFRIGYRESSEVLNHLLLARDLDYLPIEDADRLESDLGSIRRQLWRLIAKSQR